MNRDNTFYTEPDPAGVFIFPENIFSVGPGYDHVTSIFTAPVRGLYFFTATLRQRDEDTIFYLVLNGAHIRQGAVDTATSSNTATVNSILMLESGDRVHVEVEAGDEIACWLCNFDGYMLYESI